MKYYQLPLPLSLAYNPKPSTANPEIKTLEYKVPEDISFRKSEIRPGELEVTALKLIKVDISPKNKKLSDFND